MTQAIHTPEDRFKHDPVFHAMVSSIAHHLRSGVANGSDYRQAVDLAEKIVVYEMAEEMADNVRRMILTDLSKCNIFGGESNG